MPALGGAYTGGVQQPTTTLKPSDMAALLGRLNDLPDPVAGKVSATPVVPPTEPQEALSAFKDPAWMNMSVADFMAGQRPASLRAIGAQVDKLKVMADINPMTKLGDMTAMEGVRYDYMRARFPDWELPSQKQWGDWQKTARADEAAAKKAATEEKVNDVHAFLLQHGNNPVHYAIGERLKQHEIGRFMVSADVPGGWAEANEDAVRADTEGRLMSDVLGFSEPKSGTSGATGSERLFVSLGEAVSLGRDDISHDSFSPGMNVHELMAGAQFMAEALGRPDLALTPADLINHKTWGDQLKVPYRELVGEEAKAGLETITTEAELLYMQAVAEEGEYDDTGMADAKKIKMDLVISEAQMLREIPGMVSGIPDPETGETIDAEETGWWQENALDSSDGAALLTKGWDAALGRTSLPPRVAVGVIMKTDQMEVALDIIADNSKVVGGKLVPLKEFSGDDPDAWEGRAAAVYVKALESYAARIPGKTAVGLMQRYGDSEKFDAAGSHSGPAWAADVRLTEEQRLEERVAYAEAHHRPMPGGVTSRDVYKSDTGRQMKDLGYSGEEIASILRGEVSATRVTAGQARLRASRGRGPVD